VNEWFKKQYRTDIDAKLDDTEPNRQEPPPIDNDNQKVAPATDHSHVRGRLPGGGRPLKGGYWFIRQKFLPEAMEALAKDKEKSEDVGHEMQVEGRAQSRVSPIQSRQPSRQPSQLGSPIQSRQQSRHPSVRPSPAPQQHPQIADPTTHGYSRRPQGRYEGHEELDASRRHYEPPHPAREWQPPR